MLDLLAALPNAAEYTVGLLCHKSTLLTHVLPGVPRSFSTNLLSTWMASRTSWCLVPPQEPDFAFLVESHEVSTSLVSSLPRSPWVTAQPLGVSATPPRHSSFLRSSESRHHVMPST